MTISTTRAVLAITACATAMIAGCAATQRPVLYPNAQLQSAGPAIAQSDIEDCMRMAEQHGVQATPTGKAESDTLEGGAKGAVVGTAVGAAAGDVGRGAAVGAAGGAAGGLVGNIFNSGKPDPMFRRFVEKCLRDKGYDVIGWQ